MFIRAGNTAATASTFKCVKTYFTGTLGGTVTGFRPAQGTPEAATTTTKDGTGLDGVKDVVDSPTTADHSGSPVAGSTMTSTFDKSCNDIYTANASGKPFYSTGSTTATVPYTMAPTTVFP